MKLPEKIKGKNKIRDGAIVLYFKRDGIDYHELAVKFKLTERRILQILAKNHAFVKIDKEWEKDKRINRLRRRLKEMGEKTFPLSTQSDELNVIGELRNEINGDEKNQRSSETRVIIIRDNGNQDQDRSVSRFVSIQRG